MASWSNRSFTTVSASSSARSSACSTSGSAAGLAALSPLLMVVGAMRRARGLAGHLPSDSGRPARPAIHDLQVPHDGPRRGGAIGRAGPPQRDDRPGIQDGNDPRVTPIGVSLRRTTSMSFRSCSMCSRET